MILTLLLQNLGLESKQLLRYIHKTYGILESDIELLQRSKQNKVIELTNRGTLTRANEVNTTTNILKFRYVRRKLSKNDTTSQMVRNFNFVEINVK